MSVVLDVAAVIDSTVVVDAVVVLDVAAVIDATVVVDAVVVLYAAAVIDSTVVVFDAVVVDSGNPKCYHNIALSAKNSRTFPFFLL